jgi:transposase InsO family protein
VRTIGRVMALNRLVYDDIPHVPKRGVKPAPGPHPYKAQARHQYWFIDGRRMDFAIDGVQWWSLTILEGYSRTILAGAVAPTEATWVALMVLYTACVRYGVPGTLISDSGGAYTSNEFEAVCTRLQIQHETIVSTQGESYQNLMETHFNIQRRLYDYQFSLAPTPSDTMALPPHADGERGHCIRLLGCGITRRLQVHDRPFVSRCARVRDRRAKPGTMADSP